MDQKKLKIGKDQSDTVTDAEYMSSIALLSAEDRRTHLNEERNRFHTLRAKFDVNDPTHDITALAANGFYYDPSTSTVRCAFCDAMNNHEGGGPSSIIINEPTENIPFYEPGDFDFDGPQSRRRLQAKNLDAVSVSNEIFVKETIYQNLAKIKEIMSRNLIMDMMIPLILLVYCSSANGSPTTGLYNCESMDSLINGISPDTDCMLYIRNITDLRGNMRRKESRMTDLDCEFENLTANLTECHELINSIRDLNNKLKDTINFKNRSCRCDGYGVCTACGPVLCSKPGGLIRDAAQTCMEKCKAFTCHPNGVNPTPKIPATEDTPSVKPPASDIPIAKPPVKDTNSAKFDGWVIPPPVVVIVVCGVIAALVITPLAICFLYRNCQKKKCLRGPTRNSGKDLTTEALLLESSGKPNTTTTTTTPRERAPVEDQEQDDPQNDHYFRV